MSITESDLLLFFDRPWEPCFMQKGAAGTMFDIPDEYLPEKFQPRKRNRLVPMSDSTNRSVPLPPPTTMPDLTLPLKLPYYNHFSLFIPRHQQYAEKLIEIFMSKELQDPAKLTAVAAYCQLRINPYMFLYCLSVAMLHRPGMKRNIVSLLKTFPDLFIEGSVLRQARELIAIDADAYGLETLPVFVDIPQENTASKSEPEQRVAYFREDIGINLHHWHWHLVYPTTGGPAIVSKDRRGELFYYMHQQIMARYTAERFCNKLGPVERYSDLRATIAEGYFPKMDSQAASRAWPPRFENVKILDLNRPVEGLHMEVSQMERWRDLIVEAIEAGAIELPTGEKLALDEATGIETLGNLVESTSLSRNSAKYGNLHNMGHNFIAFVHDPDNRFLEQFGVMGESSTAMRDPIFYRWHAHMDDIFNMHKAKLPAYTPEQLGFPPVHVSSVVVRGGCGADDVLRTRWERSTVELTHGLDFQPRRHVAARFIHLQHEPFQYHIEVQNNCGRDLTGAVRIFLAPKNDENGQPLCFEAQRRLMIELDKFSTPLRPGHNVITRKSEESSVTIPYDRTFRNQDARPGEPGSEEAAAFDFCGCGWPHHMLLPKGTAEGYPVVLFVMVSDWDKDRVETASVGLSKDAASYCGIRDRKYPDRRAMGFPFDRPNPAKALHDFLQPNMAVRPCTIRFSDDDTESQIEKEKCKSPYSHPHHHCCHVQSEENGRCSTQKPHSHPHHHCGHVQSEENRRCSTQKPHSHSRHHCRH